MRRFLRTGGRVVVHTTLGAVLLVAGTIMLVTPGPGIVTIILGLAVLSREYTWAARLQGRVLGRIRDASTSARARVAATRGARGPSVTDLRRPDELPGATERAS